MPFQEHIRPTLDSFCGPVTALAIWSQKALVGCGNEVSIYCLNSFHLETRKQVLHGACIHGFSQGGLVNERNKLICVYGAKQACVIAIQTNTDSTIDLSLVSGIVHLPDWIWEARWVKYAASNNTISFALAHNTVVLWDWEAKNIIHQRDCVEKCILYCAHFIGDTWTELVLAAGTVFNQVVLWLVCDGNEGSQESAQSPVPVMHTLSGHKGVIFSIKYHAACQRICSVSDDRSIRMWQIDFPNGRSSAPNAEDWRGMKSSLLLSVFGHSARVFDAVLMTHYFASVGEDATCCIWDYSGQVITKFKGHKGKCIWSVAATEDELNILTGGGDGSVRMWKINTGQDGAPTQQALDVSKILPVEQDDFPRTVTLLDFDKVLIMMNSGSLYCYSVGLHQFDCVFKDARFTSYSVVSSCPDKVKVAAASIGGVIKILKLISGKLHEALSIEKTLFDHKILAVVWMSHDRLIVSGQNGTCHILQITEQMNENNSPVLRIAKEASLFLPMAKHRWVSAACFVNTLSESGVMSTKKLLACGDKDGTIYLYQIPAETSTTCELIQPIQSFHKVHGKNGVTHVICQDGVLYSVGRDGCCRHWGLEQGRLVLHHGSKVVKGFEWIDRVECSNQDLMFYGFFSTQFVIWSQNYNQKMFYVECGGGHRSWGCCHDNGVFRFTYLKGGMVHIVDSAQCSRHEILKPPLHGRELHDVKLLEMSDTNSLKRLLMTFTASEDTTITIGSYNDKDGFMHWRPLATLKGHLSSVRALALLQEPWKDQEHLSPIKDCHRNKDTKRDCVNVNGYQRDFILFTGGGRAEIRVWRVRVKNSVESDSERTNVEYVQNLEQKVQDKNLQQDSLEADVKKEVDPVVCTHQEWSTHYLGESRHKRPFSKWKTRKLCLDPETRVMSLDATSICDIGIFPEGFDSKQNCDAGDETSVPLEHLHIVSAAGSDGLLRVFCYNNETRRLNPVAQSTFHQGCVLKVVHFHFKSKSCHLFLAFSTSTNGHIAIWSMDPVARRAVVMENESCQSKTDNRFMGTKLCKAHSHGLSPSHSTVTEEQVSHEMSGRGDGVDGASAHDDAAYSEDGGGDKIEEDFSPLCSLPAHQSGINSIHALQIDDTCFLLASGGDDNALTLQVVKVKGQEVKVECHTTNTNAHCAQITGLRIVSDSLLVSGSIDQRICVWTLDLSGGKAKMELLSCSYIYLADVSCMDICVSRNGVYLCLGGEGLCLYSWKGGSNLDRAAAVHQ